MSMPAMDRPSVMFAHLLDNIEVENDSSTGDFVPVLVCQSCAETICAIDNNDSMRTLLNTALAHQCTA